MKTVNVSTTLATAILTLGLVSAAAAMPSHSPLTLHEGNTTSRAVGGTDRYAFELDAPSRVVITSRSADVIGGAHIRMHGKLLDESGQEVATAQRRGGQFVLDREMPAGRYTLVVESRNRSGNQDGVNRYLLRANL